MHDSKSGQEAYATLRKAWDIRRSLNASAKNINDDKRILLSDATIQYPPVSPDDATEPYAPIKDTVLYLAYGSNLSASTFLTRRGIKPLNARNVLVPSLELCFDLPGIPYNEPCFANTRLRTVKPPPYPYPSPPIPIHPPLEPSQAAWKKGLVGVVYEVTRTDYAKIIATEGGGSSYQDIPVLCFEIPKGTNIVDPIPRSIPFKAHTLFSPSLPPTKPGEPSKPIGRVGRPNPDYAQASQRYLKLIQDGSAEHDMPLDYQNYLLRLQPYKTTSTRQEMGKFIFECFWMPILFLLITLGSYYADETGRVPAWLAVVSNYVHAGVWWSYDGFFRKVFGDGERTQEEDEGLDDAWVDEKKGLMYEV